jgi:hypothetical protein
MSATRLRRRPRGTAVNTVQLLAHVDPQAKRNLQDIAQRMGISLGEFVEKIEKNLELDGRGLPTWWDPKEQRQEELALNERSLMTG